MVSRLRSTVPLALLLLITASAYSAPPPSNTIPVISMKTGQDSTCEDITLNVILMLLWNNFDGIWVEGWLTGQAKDPAVLCDSTNAVLVLAPSRLQGLQNWPPTRWGRYTTQGIGTDSAFIHPNPNDFKEIFSIATADSILGEIEDRCNLLHAQATSHSCIWYYDIFNEAPAWQLSAMLNDTSAVDDYFPSMFTQDIMMTEVLPSSVFSWIKWKSDGLYDIGGPTVSVCHSMLHTIENGEWAGYGGISLGTTTTQANSVNAYFSMEYLNYDGSPPYALNSNTPERMDLNSYPVRLAGYEWQYDEDSITVLGSATDLWMLEHYELLMDSTFIPAGNHQDGPFPIHYHPQAFGRTGGESIWSIDTTTVPWDTLITYHSYDYRIPSPAEFRMLCNIALLRGAKGLFPYSIRSYSRWDGDALLRQNAGLLDENLIPFDAPYEDWVYRARPTGDYWYAPPDSIPPWTAADGSQFDPLYALPSRPSTAGAKAREDYLEWKFAAYGRLWNSVSATFRQSAWVAPELSRLWWWYTGDRYDNASISYNSATIPLYFADPHIRVFTDSTESTCYLFYVNRFCRANDNPFEITVDAGDFPSGTPFSKYALDHSRRFLIEGELTGRVEYTFLDTLDAGEARLLQMFDSDAGLAADVRITDPDIFVIIPADGDTLLDFSTHPGVPVDVVARFYNMGTEPLSDVMVYMRNETRDELIARDTVSFSGLSINSCCEPDVSAAVFSWTPEADDIGANVLRVYTEAIPGEPDPSDNSATLVYMVRPRDYAREVLDDPWDMSPPSPPVSPPAWNTWDIDSLTGCWGGYTDSISGMFEGVLSNPTQPNRLYLNTGTGPSSYIDADVYHNLSLAGMSGTKTAIQLHWIDSQDNTGYIALEDTLRPVAADLGPWDIASLSDNGWTGSMKKLWLEFTSPNVISPSNVRIGWVKLTE